ncbi:g1484 [Coccomyxa viridis]|uniref:G1484 protein n=1 Tax=Coccomyxa viridis TaxID=1274662 RepID=A0ABP1FK80_9CHLO
MQTGQTGPALGQVFADIRGTLASLMSSKGTPEGLQRIILSWDFWEIEDNASNGGGVIPDLEALPKSFDSAEDYVYRFEPLVLEECGALMLRGNEEGIQSEPFQAVCASHKLKGEFLLARLAVPPSVAESLRENDAVLLSKEDPNSEDAEGRLHAIGRVDSKEGTNIIIVQFHLTAESQAGNPAGVQRVRAMQAGLQTKESCWYLLRLCNLTTIQREWCALHAFPKLPFRSTLLSATAPDKPQEHALVIPEAVQQAMAAEYNESQMAAVTAGLDRSPVILIQGPPGTGKTRTIMGLLSIILHAAPANTAGLVKRAAAQPMPDYARGDLDRLWRLASPWLSGTANPRDEVVMIGTSHSSETFGLLDMEQPIRVGKTVGPKAHVLVCAPSNSALDEIVARLLQHGVLDWRGDSYSPSIVRVGLSVHHSVMSVAMDTLINKRMQSEKGSASSARASREKARMAILEEADIVCSTLSFSGAGLFERMSRPFDVVVIDEAAQAVEPSTLVPMVLGCQQVFLVGDPVQLPATVISDRADKHGYSTSLFKRLQTSGFPVQMLDTQYRMHPRIAHFPAATFYAGNLRNGEGVEAGTSRTWHEHPCFGPLALFHVDGTEAIEERATSILNVAEASMVLSLYMELRARYSHLSSSNQIAVISPYKAQVGLLRSKFDEALGERARQLVDVSTIDGFQGREKDIVIFSAVRSTKSKGGRSRIGFVADERRLNVGLTRARASLLVVGNFQALQSDANWRALVQHAKVTGCFYRVVPPIAQYLGRVVKGELGPTAQKAKAQGGSAFVPQAEPEVEDDADLYSDAEDMDTAQ